MPFAKAFAIIPSSYPRFFFFLLFPVSLEEIGCKLMIDDD